MYKYTVKPNILEMVEAFHPYNSYITYGSFVSNIKPYIPDAVDNKIYYYYQAFRDIWDFCFYSKTKLEVVPLNGVAFPVTLFEVEEI